MSRSQIGVAWAYSTDGNLTAIPAPSRNITAGSVVVYRWRYEGGAPALTSFSDGTAAVWYVVEYGTNPTVGRAVCLAHPGGTGTVGTVNLSGSRSANSIDGVELDGTVPAAIDDAPAGVNGTNATVNYTSTGDGTAFAVTGYYSLSSTTPTAPAELESSAYAYAGYWKNNHTGAGAKSMAMTGGSGNTNTLVVVIADAAGGGDTTAPVLTSPTGTATGSTTATGSVTTDEAGPGSAVLTTSSTTPTSTQIEAGQDHTGATAAASDTATLSVGSNPAAFSFSGLSPSTTYYLHVTQDDTATPTPNTATPVTSSSFTTSAPGVFPPVLLRAFRPAILNH